MTSVVWERYRGPRWLTALVVGAMVLGTLVSASPADASTVVIEGFEGTSPCSAATEPPLCPAPTGWIQTAFGGTTTAIPESTTTEGSRYGYVDTRSGGGGTLLSTSFSLQAGDELCVDFFFATQEALDGSRHDFGYAQLLDASTSAVVATLVTASVGPGQDIPAKSMPAGSPAAISPGVQLVPSTAELAGRRVGIASSATPWVSSCMTPGPNSYRLSFVVRDHSLGDPTKVTALVFDNVRVNNADVVTTSSTSTTSSSTSTTSSTTSTTEPARPSCDLDVDTCDLEGSIGHWIPWFSSAVSRSTAQAQGGVYSLRVDVTAPYGWGVQLDNWPGFAATPGGKVLGFSGVAGSPAASLGASMAVRWRDLAGTVVDTDTTSIPSLTTTWKQVSVIVSAPPETAYADVSFSDPSGQAGDFLFLDDIVVIDSAVGPPSPAGLANVLDAETSGFEEWTGRWVPWFSTSVARSTAQAHTGDASMKVDVTAPYGWGVTLDNWPGFAATSGPYAIGFWGKAGSSTNMSATMQVTWRTPSGGLLQTDLVTLALAATWEQAAANVVAPAGTAKVAVDFLNSSGVSGDSVFLDDIDVTGVPSPPPNALDADTSTAEGSVGKWVPWFSSNVSRSTAQAHTGAASLRVDVSAPFGWGVTLANWPGFDAASGPHTLGFWGLAVSNSALSATMQVSWRTDSGAVLGTDLLTLPLTTSWQRAAVDVVAPPGTSKANVDLLNASGTTGDVLWLDDVVIAG